MTAGEFTTYVGLYVMQDGARSNPEAQAPGRCLPSSAIAEEEEGDDGATSPAQPRRRRPKKWVKLMDIEAIQAARTTGCCSGDHQRLFTDGEVVDARARMCSLSEQQVTIQVTAMLQCMLRSDGVSFMLRGHIVCRAAFAWYYGLARKKLQHALTYARGMRRFS